MRPVGIAGIASYLPERWMPAAELAERSGIPEQVIVERFGLRGKHIAADAEHASDLAVRAAERVLAETGTDPQRIDAVVYFGSTWKDFPVWHAAPHIAYRLGCTGAFALELDYVSCGAPVALRVVRDLLRAEPDLGSVLAVAGCRESYLIDPANPRTRFMLNFGDGAVAAVLTGGSHANEVLGCHMVTDGSFSLDVKVPAGGHLLDVPDPAAMKTRLDPVSLPNFVAAAEGALKRSGATLADLDHVCGIHMKRSMHDGVVAALGLEPHQATYLDDTGHMSGVDPLLGLDRAARAGRVRHRDLVLLLAAGTGYTWAAAAVRWG